MSTVGEGPSEGLPLSWAKRGGRWMPDRYQQRFDELAAAGQNVHGEADFVMELGPSRVLDAGCGTGRVARELARRGVEVVGVDPDPSMIAAAREHAPGLEWVEEDMARVDLGRTFDVVVMAGNVPLFTRPANRGPLVAGCARHLERAGALVCGFQLDRGYGLEEYDEHCRRAGLDCVERWATWSRDPFEGGDYAVSVHRFVEDEDEGTGTGTGTPPDG